jgi:hypothetical protein
MCRIWLWVCFLLLCRPLLSTQQNWVYRCFDGTWADFFFFFLAVFMAVDMLGRLNGAVGRRPVDQGKKLK